jgi:hypothetical protein
MGGLDSAKEKPSFFFFSTPLRRFSRDHAEQGQKRTECTYISTHEERMLMSGLDLETLPSLWRVCKFGHTHLFEI